MPAQGDDVAEGEDHRVGYRREDEEPGLRGHEANLRRRALQHPALQPDSLGAGTHHNVENHADAEADAEANEALAGERTEESERVRGNESLARERTGLAWRDPRCCATHLLLGQRARLVHLVDDAGRLRLDAHLTTASQQCALSQTPPPLYANRGAGQHRGGDAPAA